MSYHLKSFQEPQWCLCYSLQNTSSVWNKYWSSSQEHQVWGRQILPWEAVLLPEPVFQCRFHEPPPSPSLCSDPSKRVHPQLCSTFCDPMDSSLPGSSAHDILQARILVWVAISSSRGSSRPRDWTCISCVSCIGRQILYHWVIQETPWPLQSLSFILQGRRCVQANTGIRKMSITVKLGLLQELEYMITTFSPQKGVKNDLEVHCLIPYPKARATKWHTYKWVVTMYT